MGGGSKFVFHAPPFILLSNISSGKGKHLTSRPHEHTCGHAHASFPCEVSGMWYYSVCCWSWRCLAGREKPWQKMLQVKYFRYWNGMCQPMIRGLGMQKLLHLRWSGHLDVIESTFMRCFTTAGEGHLRKLINPDILKLPKHIWNKMHVFNIEEQKVFWQNFSGKGWKDLHCLPGLLWMNWSNSARIYCVHANITAWML